MKIRIKKIMDESGLSASKFADKIGVPRSGLSHVLSGRNKPSLDYVVKILNAFPGLDPNWLIRGEENEVKIDLGQRNAEKSIYPNRNSQLNTSLAKVNKKMGGQADKLVEKIIKESKDAPEERNDVNSKVNSTTSVVERIVYFSSDGSFPEYRPK